MSGHQTLSDTFRHFVVYIFQDKLLICSRTMSLDLLSAWVVVALSFRLVTAWTLDLLVNGIDTIKLPTAWRTEFLEWDGDCKVCGGAVDLR